MRQLISFALKRLRGVRIVEANDGVDGLKKLAAEKFDLIFTDINMPIMDGLKLVSLVRNDANYRNTPVVVMGAGSSSVTSPRYSTVTEFSPPS